MSKLLSKVLFIEDDDSIYNVLKPRLLKKGIFLIRARNGIEGIKKAKKEVPEIIITDIVMPKMNGFEMIRILKSFSMMSQVKFIILSNYGEASLLYDGDFLNSLGISKYLIKSNHTPAEIVNEITSILE